MLYRKILKAFKSYFTLFDVCRFPSLVLGHHVQCNSLIIFCLIPFSSAFSSISVNPLLGHAREEWRGKNFTLLRSCHVTRNKD